MPDKINNQQPVLVYPQYLEQRDDEINLFDVVQTLIQNKKTILSITLLFSIVSVIYALAIPKVWQSEIHFAPTLTSNILGLQGQSPNYLYSVFFANFNSLSQRRHFFTENNLIDHYQDNLSEDKQIRTIQITKAFNKFNKSLNLQSPNKKESNKYRTATFELSRPKLTSDILNKYSQSIHTYTLNTLLKEIEKAYQYKKTSININITFLKKFDKQNIKDKINVLNEAIKIAKVLGVKEAKLEIIDDKTGTANLSSMTNQAKISAMSSFLYLRGYKALEIEKEALLERQGNTSFIPAIRTLEEKADRLKENIERIIKNKASYKIVTVDQEAMPPISPIKPKRKLIVILGTILGFFVSLITVFFLTIKKKYASEYRVPN